MSKIVKQLITDIINLAKPLHLSQGALANRVGIDPVTLSRNKKAGDIKASTLNELANQVGMELALVPKKTKSSTAQKVMSGSFFRSTNKEG